MKLNIFIFFLLFNIVVSLDLMNENCDEQKCKNLCLKYYGFDIKEFVDVIRPASKCEYYSYCSCYKDNMKTRLN